MKRITIFLALLLVLSLSAFQQIVSAADEVTLDFYGHTDFLGNLQQSDTAPGAAILAAAEASLAENNPDGSFFFVLGDALSGTPIAALVEGRSVVEAFNAMPYDAFTLGNHEFD